MAAAPPPSPGKVLVHGKVGSLSDLRTWSVCLILLSVLVNREHYADRHGEI